MRSALDSQNNELTARINLKPINATLAWGLLGLTLSSWPSPVMSQPIDPQMKSMVTNSNPLLQKGPGLRDRPLGRDASGTLAPTLASGTSRITENPRENRLRPDSQVSETPDGLLTSAEANQSAKVAIDRPNYQSDDRQSDDRDLDTDISQGQAEPSHREPVLDPNSAPQQTNQDFPFLASSISPIGDRANHNMGQNLEPNIEPNLDREHDPLGQITSVSQLSDVKPTDWAFQALQSLVERYGCISGYPDLTYRGDRALTRYEFVAALNACWDQIYELVQASQSSGPAQADLIKLQQLRQEFAEELAIFKDQLETLTTQTTVLEGQQFSTTTKLFGQAIFGLQGRTANEADFFPVDGEKDTKDPGSEINLINNLQLTLLTQLNSRSLILAGMQMGSGSTGPRLSNDTRLGYEGNTDEQIVLSDLNYRRLIGRRVAVVVGPAGVNMANVFRGVNEVESAGRGPISALAQRNPIVNIGNGRGGVGFDWQVTSRMSVQGVYAASTPADVGNGGIFGGNDGQTSLGLQLTLTPIDPVNLSLSYVNAYSPFGVLGTGSGDDQLTVDSPIKTNAFGATMSWRMTPDITLGSWAGYTNSGIPGRDGEVETTNWMVFLNWENLFGRDNLAGLYVGQPPKIIDSNLPVGKNIPDLLAGGEGEPGGQPGTTTHLELFYRWQLSDQISLTPGLLMIFEPGHAPASDAITVGVLRTTFNF